MKKILTYLSIALTIFISSEAYARIGGFRSYGFRSYSYSRPSRSTYTTKSYSSTKTSTKANTTTTTSKNTANTASNTTSKKQSSTVNDEPTTSSTKTSNTTSTTLTQSPSIFTNAPLWFLVGYASSSDKVNVINNTTETFKCSDCETVKNEQEVYDACMKKCVK